MRATCWARRVILGGAAILTGCGDGRETEARAVPFVRDSASRRANVTERVANDTLSLGPGEVRAWNLAPGNYQITVHAPPPAGEPQVIDLAAELVCAPDGFDHDTIHCLVREPTRLVLKHNGVRSATPRRQVVVTILRVTW